MSYQISRSSCSFFLCCSICLLGFSFTSHAALSDVTRIFRQTPTLAQFEVCHGGGCVETNQLSITDAEWKSVTQLFANKAKSAADERVQIANAIGELESIVGQKNGTNTDLAGTFFEGKLAGQLDCNDEAINTTTYMRLLKTNDLIQFHEIEDTRTRNFFFTGWPHSTAVIHEIETGERFAVDSWFYDNGHAATIVPFETWKANYQPADSQVEQAKTKHSAVPTHSPQ